MTAKKVLVIDDDENILRIMVEYLDVLGVKAITTNDPREGIEMAKEEKPDVILTDIMMPGMPGEEVAEVLRTDPATSHIPIIFMTALADAEDTEKMPKGGYRFLAKGLPPDEFQKKLKELIS